MKISLDRILNQYNTVPGAKKMEQKGNTSSITERNFDEIVINTDARTVAESRFTDQLSRNLSADIRKSTSESKITELKEKTQQGTYRIDADAIASKILLQPEEK